MIDNGLTSGTNACADIIEKIHTASAALGFAVLRRLRALVGRPLGDAWSVAQVIRDMKRAYRQLPVLAAHLCFSVIGVWDPERQIWRFGILHGLAFGLTAAVHGFARYPVLVVAFSRRWFALPAMNYLDDFKVVDASLGDAAPGGGATCFDAIVEWLGWLFDEEKRQEGESVLYLGALESFFEDSILHCPAPGREEVIAASLARVVTSGVLTQADAASLCGRLNHLSETYTGRVGRAQMYVFNQVAAGAEVEWAAILKAAKFHLQLIAEAPYREVPLMRAQARTTMYTDASCEEDPTRPSGYAARCCFLLFADEDRVGGVADVPDDLLMRWGERGHYIAIAEALAPLLALHLWPNLFDHRLLVAFVDNMPVLSTFVTGGSRVADLSDIANEVLRGLLVSRRLFCVQIVVTQ